MCGPPVHRPSLSAGTGTVCPPRVSALLLCAAPASEHAAGAVCESGTHAELLSRPGAPVGSVASPASYASVTNEGKCSRCGVPHPHILHATPYSPVCIPLQEGSTPSLSIGRWRAALGACRRARQTPPRAPPPKLTYPACPPLRASADRAGIGQVATKLRPSGAGGGLGRYEVRQARQVGAQACM